MEAIWETRQLPATSRFYWVQALFRYIGFRTRLSSRSDKTRPTPLLQWRRTLLRGHIQFLAGHNGQLTSFHFHSNGVFRYGHYDYSSLVDIPDIHYITRLISRYISKETWYWATRCRLSISWSYDMGHVSHGRGLRCFNVVRCVQKVCWRYVPSWLLHCQHCCCLSAPTKTGQSLNCAGEIPSGSGKAKAEMGRGSRAVRRS